MRYRAFGRTGLQVSELVFGGGFVGGILIHADDDTKLAALRCGLDGGMNWIDTAPSYGDGKYTYQGRDAIMGFLRGALGRPTILTAHHGHHPEIELSSETTATGTWALWDKVIDLQHGIEIGGAAFYRDGYVKLAGAWRFQSTGYQRTFEEMKPRPADGPARLTANRFA